MDFAESSTGTPYFLSPEICQGLKYNYKSDIWMLGCTIYELTTLQKPFNSTTLINLMKVILTKNLDFKLIESVGYSKGLVSVIKSMLNKTPEERPLACDIIDIYLKENSKICKNISPSYNKNINCSNESISYIGSSDNDNKDNFKINKIESIMKKCNDVLRSKSTISNKFSNSTNNNVAKNNDSNIEKEENKDNQNLNNYLTQGMLLFNNTKTAKSNNNRNKVFQWNELNFQKNSSREKFRSSKQLIYNNTTTTTNNINNSKNNNSNNISTSRYSNINISNDNSNLDNSNMNVKSIIRNYSSNNGKIESHYNNSIYNSNNDINNIDTDLIIKKTNSSSRVLNIYDNIYLKNNNTKKITDDLLLQFYKMKSKSRDKTFDDKDKKYYQPTTETDNHIIDRNKNNYNYDCKNDSILAILRKNNSFIVKNSEIINNRIKFISQEKTNTKKIRENKNNSCSDLTDTREKLHINKNSGNNSKLFSINKNFTKQKESCNNNKAKIKIKKFNKEEVFRVKEKNSSESKLIKSSNKKGKNKTKKHSLNYNCSTSKKKRSKNFNGSLNFNNNSNYNKRFPPKINDYNPNNNFKEFIKEEKYNIDEKDDSKAMIGKAKLLLENINNVCIDDIYYYKDSKKVNCKTTEYMDFNNNNGLIKDILKNKLYTTGFKDNSSIVSNNNKNTTSMTSENTTNSPDYKNNKCKLLKRKISFSINPSSNGLNSFVNLGKNSNSYIRMGNLNNYSTSNTNTTAFPKRSSSSCADDFLSFSLYNSGERNGAENTAPTTTQKVISTLSSNKEYSLVNKNINALNTNIKYFNMLHSKKKNLILNIENSSEKENSVNSIVNTDSNNKAKENSKFSKSKTPIVNSNKDNKSNININNIKKTTTLKNPPKCPKNIPKTTTIKSINEMNSKTKTVLPNTPNNIHNSKNNNDNINNITNVHESNILNTEYLESCYSVMNKNPNDDNLNDKINKEKNYYSLNIHYNSNNNSNNEFIETPINANIQMNNTNNNLHLKNNIFKKKKLLEIQPYIPEAPQTARNKNSELLDIKKQLGILNYNNNNKARIDLLTESFVNSESIIISNSQKLNNSNNVKKFILKNSSNSSNILSNITNDKDNTKNISFDINNNSFSDVKENKSNHLYKNSSFYRQLALEISPKKEKLVKKHMKSYLNSLNKSSNKTNKYDRDILNNNNKRDSANNCMGSYNTYISLNNNINNDKDKYFTFGKQNNLLALSKNDILVFNNKNRNNELKEYSNSLLHNSNNKNTLDSINTNNCNTNTLIDNYNISKNKNIDIDLNNIFYKDPPLSTRNKNNNNIKKSLIRYNDCDCDY